MRVIKACGNSCVACQRECAVILGSLVTEGEQYVIEEAQNVAIQPLLDIVITNSNGATEEASSLLEAVTRSLRALCRYPGEHRNAPFDVQKLDGIFI